MGDVGLRVRRWRLRRGLSQRALAELAGFTQGYIAQIETGAAGLEKPSTQAAIAEALRVSVADLTGRPQINDPHRPSRLDRQLTALRSSLALLSSPLATALADGSAPDCGGSTPPGATDHIAEITRLFHGAPAPPHPLISHRARRQ